ncbi:MAG TPA: dihydropteroate synthase [Thermoguttaceae bacterium]|nr:dihydropteroate synthase [Thermoguttaceae bacterium]
MAIQGLTIIGETINDSVPSTHTLFDAGDIDGILELAKMQDEKGAAFIDVNVGPRSAEFMADMVRKIQAVTSKPLSIDTPDPVIAKAGLEAYNLDRAGGRKPVLNSISPLRMTMFDLYAICPFMPILLVSERMEGSQAMPCRTAEETYQAAQAMAAAARAVGKGIPNKDLIFDPGIAPVGSDSEGNLKRLVQAAAMIHGDPDFAGVHMSVGLSNFTVMLPSKKPDGSPVKGPLESAFLTKVMPLGLDMIIGSVKRKYELLGSDDPAMQCLEDILKTDDGFEAIMRVRDFYA